MKSKLTLTFLLTLVLGQAQDIGVAAEYTQKYPDESLVRLKQDVHIDISLQDGELIVLQETDQEDLYLNESASGNAEGSLSYSTFYELKDFEAETIALERGRERTYPVEDFVRKDDLESSFYDDSKEVKFYYPKLQAGARTRLSYTYRINNPRFLGAYFFKEPFPIEQGTFTIVTDPGIVLKFSEFHTEDQKIEFETFTKRGRTYHQWRVTSVPGLEFEDDGPGYRSLAPHIFPRVASYEVAGKQVELLDGVDDLYAWYREMISEVNQEEPLTEMKELVDQLTKDVDKREEKIHNIYQWVQENIKYIDFEYGLGGFIPRDANAVFEKKYGDCKDNSNLLQVLLELAGIESYLAWVGTRELPYTYEELPTPSVDNHMVLAVPEGDAFYFLDATGRYSEISRPSAFIQGKEALIGRSPTTFQIYTIPEVPKEENYWYDQVHLTMQGDELIGEGRATINGYNKIDLFYYLEQLKTENELQSFYRSNFQKGNNNFLITDLKEHHKYEYKGPFTLEYDFRLRNHLKSYEDEIYLNLNLHPVFRSDRKREQPRKYNYRDVYDFKYSFQVPEGFKIAYLPEDLEFQDDLVSCSITYQVSDGEIHYRHQASLEKLMYSAAEWNRLEAQIKEFEKYYKEVIVLQKNSKTNTHD